MRRRVATVAVFSAFIACFFVVMAATKANTDRAELECRAMVREAMVREAMRSYPSIAMQVVNDCAGFRGSAEDVPPMMRLY